MAHTGIPGVPRQGDHLGNAVVWAIADVAARQGSQFLVGLVLARILTPGDFGVMALVAAFASVATLLVDAGFALALIRQPVQNDDDASTAFWFNVASAIALGGALALAGNPIARFYAQPLIAGLAVAMGANVVLASLSGVHVALLTRQLDFRTQAIASGVSNIVGGALAIIAAARGAGAWALAVQVVAASTLNTIALWTIHPWRPRLVFSRASFTRLFGFGAFMMLSSILDIVATRFHAFLIGKLYPAQDLGFYSRALATRDFSQNMLASLLTRLSVPVLARHTADPDAMRRRMKAANELAMALTLPLMLGMASTSPDLVPFLFGDQWRPSAPVFSILCLSGCMWPLQLSNVNLMSAMGHSGHLAKIEVGKKAVLIVGVLVAAPFGLEWIAWATVFAAAIAFVLNAGQAKTHIDYPALRQLADIAPYACLAITMALAVLVVHHWGPMGPGAWRLALEVAVGASWYVGGNVLFRLKALPMAWGLVTGGFRTRGSTSP